MAGPAQRQNVTESLLSYAEQILDPNSDADAIEPPARQQHEAVRRVSLDAVVRREWQGNRRRPPQESVQQSRPSSQLAFQCCNLPPLLNTPKNVPFQLNLNFNLLF